jgi:hypothetical protein
MVAKDKTDLKTSSNSSFNPMAHHNNNNISSSSISSTQEIKEAIRTVLSHISNNNITEAVSNSSNNNNNTTVVVIKDTSNRTETKVIMITNPEVEAFKNQITMEEVQDPIQVIKVVNNMEAIREVVMVEAKDVEAITQAVVEVVKEEEDQVVSKVHHKRACLFPRVPST